MDKSHAIMERDEFCSIFKRICKSDYVLEQVLDAMDGEGETSSFFYIYSDDTHYIYSKDYGTMVNWYKNLGRAWECTDGMEKDDVITFLHDFIYEYMEENYE